MKRLLGALARLGLVFAGLFLVALGAARVLAAPLPAGAAGADAEALADRILLAVNTEAWGRTGAVRWTMFGKEHLWDRQRELFRLRDGTDEVVVNLKSGGVRRWKSGVETRRLGRIGANAYATFINDAWWLNPVVKIRDEGVVRREVGPGEGLDGRAGERGLLVSWESGGLTPGDSYLWWPGSDDRPRSWQMWVSILPIGGITVTWEGWITLATGAWVATIHDFSPGPRFELTDVAGANDLLSLEGRDEFAGRLPQ